uniref:Uncharacterized protein n=2 Tax=Dunaliella tertiolecta TaxID=3047 RepID=A0A7S3VM19_DUNTE
MPLPPPPAAATRPAASLQPHQPQPPQPAYLPPAVSASQEPQSLQYVPELDQYMLVPQSGPGTAQQPSQVDPDADLALALHLQQQEEQEMAAAERRRQQQQQQQQLREEQQEQQQHREQGALPCSLHSAAQGEPSAPATASPPADPVHEQQQGQMMMVQLQSQSWHQQQQQQQPWQLYDPNQLRQPFGPHSHAPMPSHLHAPTHSPLIPPPGVDPEAALRENLSQVGLSPYLPARQPAYSCAQGPQQHHHPYSPGPLSLQQELNPPHLS